MRRARNDSSPPKWSGLLALAAALLMLGLAGAPAASEAGGGPRATASDLTGSAAPAAATAANATASFAKRLLAAQRLESQLGRTGIVDINRATGGARLVARLDGFLTGPSSRRPEVIVRSFVRSRPEVFGLSSDDLAGFRLSRSWEASGYTHLVFEQLVSGVPVTGSGLVANVMRDGRLINVSGSAAPVEPPTTLTPMVKAQEAIASAYRERGESPPQSLRLRGDPRDRRSAVLMLATGGGEAKLVWRVVGVEASRRGFSSLVDAVTGRVIREVSLARDANARVFEYYPGAATGGTQTTVDITAYTTNPGGNALFGPNARVFSDVNANEVISGSEEIPPSSGVDYLHTFTPFSFQAGNCPAVGCSWNHTVANSWQTNRAQAGTQAFYFVNRFHDHLLASPIEFTPAKGNYEGASDRVWVDVFEGASTNSGLPDADYTNNAFFSGTPFGTPPLLVLLLAQPDARDPTNAATDTANDASIVYHEYTHGLSDRLVADADGLARLDGLQAGALAESWSDWYAMDFIVGQGLLTDTAAGGEVNMARFVNASGWRTQGIDCVVGGSAADCPGSSGAGSGGYTYGDIGDVIDYHETHADGEVWAETLWDLRRALITAHGSTEGVRRARLLVTRGMELTPWDPSFLDARNAILQADTAFNGGADRNLIWQVFAARGMGWYASSSDSADPEPSESFLTPPSPGNEGAIAGQVVNEDGTPLAGATVWIGGQVSGFADDLQAVTNSGGAYTIADVPAGAYPKVYASAAGGYDDGIASGVTVATEATATANFVLERDWASSEGGATISAFTGPDFTADGCGPRHAIDGTTRQAWVTTSPADPGSPGSKSITVALPTAVDISSFGVDPTYGCGEGVTSSLHTFTILTSTNGSTFTTAATGTLEQDDTFQLHSFSPAPGTGTGIRFVRLVAESTLNQNPPFSGSKWMSVTELKVYSGQPVGSGTDRIAFVSDRDGDDEIWVMNPDGSSQTKLTSNGADDSDPSWSPDKTKIAFASNRSTGGNWEIYVMNADGTEQRRLTNTAASAVDEYPSWSPDESKIVFDSTRDGDSEIWTMNADGTNQKQLTTNSTADLTASWSPDGSKITFQSNRDGDSEVWVINAADGANPTQLTANASFVDAFPNWSRDGSKIAFHSNRDGDFEVWVINAADGANPTQATANTGISDAYPGWSADGSKLVYGSTADGNWNIFTVAASGGAATRLTTHAGMDYNPDWQGVPSVTSSAAGAPTNVTASAGNALANVSWTAPASNGGSPISNYVVTPFIGATGQTPTQVGNVTSTQITGLTNGTTYTFKVAAVNAVGTGPQSAASNAVTPQASGGGSPDFSDYDGDGDSDFAIYRPGERTWYVRGVPPFVQWGEAGDIPVPADYDGDGDTDIAVYSPDNGMWYVRGQTPGQWQQWGIPGSATEIPVPADYNGDGTTDVAIYRQSTNTFWVKGQFDLQLPGAQAGDIPVPGNYDADPAFEPALFRPSTRVWLIQGQGQVQWGNVGDVPAPGDYNGDGQTDITTHSPSDGYWWPKDQAPYVKWGGIAGDVPVPGNYNGDAADTDERTIYRRAAGSENGFWYVHGTSSLWAQWGGQANDVVLNVPPALWLQYYD